MQMIKEGINCEITDQNFDHFAANTIRELHWECSKWGAAASADAEFPLKWTFLFMI
jgi:hypothetical protein